MMPSARRTLHRKLRTLVLGVLFLVGGMTLGAVAWVNSQNERQRLAQIEAEVKRNIASKAHVMVDSHALALRGLVADNAFTDVQQLVARAVRAGDGVVYGLFTSADGTIWAYASPTTQRLPEAGLQATLARSKELFPPGESPTSELPGHRDVTRFGQRLIEVSRPVIDDGEVLGVIRYGFSTELLREALGRVRAESHRTLRETLAWIVLTVLVSTLLGSWLVSRVASRIVRPLAGLTRAAEAIAAGETGIRVEVDTNDELQVLGQAFNQMQAANEDAMQKLNHAMEAALEASRLKSQFLANMSHEIRTPMNGVLGMIRLILKMPLDGKLRRYAETVDASAGALMTIVDDVLDFSKMEAGKYALQSVPFDPGIVLQEVAELQSTRAHEKGIELVCRRAPEVPQLVTGDPDRFRQILNNLVSNAIKFSERGEVFVNLTLDQAGEDSFVLRTVVEDTGIGIDEKDQSKLFDAFSQVDGSLVRRYGGTGLGLAISRRLAEMMGGAIGVTSRLGEGSSFWFTIHVERSNAPVCHRSARFPAGRRALVVEASPRWCRVIEEHMRAWGLDCDTFQEGRPALSRLLDATPDHRYDVAVVGVSLQDTTIESFIGELRASARGARLPVVVLNQLGHSVTLSEVEHEITAQVAKPLRLSELYDCLISTFEGGSHQVEPSHRDTLMTRHTGRRILIVDDNEVNQFVAVEQVEQAGYEAEVASNGEEALSKIMARRYAAVLMDCQMPVMDGYTAAQRVREWENGERHTPIIALTAHAMVGERDKVLASGMDDYLAKPLRSDALERMLERHVGDDVAEPRSVDRESATASPELDPSIERSVRLSTLFIDRVRTTLDELEEAVASADAQRVREKAHKLKGGCLAVGASTMAEAAEALQHQAKRGDLQSAGEQARGLRDQYQRVSALLRLEIEAGGNAAALQAESPQELPS